MGLSLIVLLNFYLYLDYLYLCSMTKEHSRESATTGHVFVEDDDDDDDTIMVIIMVAMMTIVKITMVVIMMVLMVMKKIGHLQCHVGPDKVTSPNT